MTEFGLLYDTGENTMTGIRSRLRPTNGDSEENRLDLKFRRYFPEWGRKRTAFIS